ncbi:MAG: hypothetical protein R2789_12775 [Microthrixaceae bacterium]
MTEVFQIDDVAVFTDFFARFDSTAVDRHPVPAWAAAAVSPVRCQQRSDEQRSGHDHQGCVLDSANSTNGTTTQIARAGWPPRRARYATPSS